MNALDKIPEDLISDIHTYYHDLQYFVGALIQLSIVKRAQENDIAFLRMRLEDINAFSIIMSAKTNFLRYLTLGSGDFVKTNIQVHKVVFRMIRGAKQIAKSNGRVVHVSLAGESFGTILGPDIFEFIPYLVIENAVKYSLNHGHIEIEVWDNEKTIDWSVVSMGPELLAGEIDHIFEKGFRGTNAKAYTNQGSGIGLYHVKVAVEMLFGGQIRASQRTQGAPILVKDMPFREIRFDISIPRNLRPE
jgi:K+-sensing histidine kinase KdpD